ncbi:hypothetical protein RCL1_004784 [Eukaryota sp. TZLM3-RCL]
MVMSEFGPLLVPTSVAVPSQQVLIPAHRLTTTAASPVYSYPSPKYPNLPNSVAIELSPFQTPQPATRLVDTSSESETDETNDNALHLFSSLKSIKDQFGPGVSLYFSFIKFLMRYSLIFFLIGLIVLIPSLLNYGTEDFSWNFNWKSIYNDVIEHTSSYTGIFTAPLIFSAGRFNSALRPLFLVSCAAVTIIMFVLPFRYVLDHEIVSTKLESLNASTRSFISVKNTSFDIIKENANIHWFVRFLRMFFGLVLWFSALLVSSGITAYTVYSFSDRPLGQVLLSVFFVFANYIWKSFSHKVVEFEKFKTYSSKYAATIFHVYVLKLAQVSVMYTVKYLVWSKNRIDTSYIISNCTCYPESLTGTQCGFDSIASQVFWIIVIDVVILSGFQFFYFALKRCFFPNSERKEFAITEFYNRVLYRMFLLSISSTVFPLMGLIIVISLFIEYIINKTSLLKVYKLDNVFGDMKATLFWLLLLNAVLALFVFPTGILYQFIGNSYSFYGYFERCSVLPLHSCTERCLL